MTSIATVVCAAAAVFWGAAQQALAQTCVATSSHESNNPNYKRGAPVRSRVGKGHILVGVVRSSVDCRPIARVRIEFFQAGPNGRYSDGVRSWAGRATVFTRPDGSYRFEGPFPGRYARTRPHIHLRVSASGFRQLNITYYPRAGATRGRLDLVLAAI